MEDAVKERLVVLAALILLSCVPYGYASGSWHVSLVVGFTYFLGVFGLWSIHDATRWKNQRKQWLAFLFGSLSIALSLVTLELLFQKMYGGFHP